MSAGCPAHISELLVSCYHYKCGMQWFPKSSHQQGAVCSSTSPPYSSLTTVRSQTEPVFVTKDDRRYDGVWMVDTEAVGAPHACWQIKPSSVLGSVWAVWSPPGMSPHFPGYLVPRCISNPACMGAAGTTATYRCAGSTGPAATSLGTEYHTGPLCSSI